MKQAHRFLASVIIPTYNRQEFLFQNLQSLRASSISKDDFEIIVVDDGSSDNSFDVVRNFAGGCQIRYVYQQDDGYRVGRARNQGMELAEGAVCIFLDCGIVVSRDFVKAHIDAHSEANAVVIGYLYGFSNTGYNSDELAEALEGNLDLNDVDATIEKLRASRRFPDMREKIYATHGEDLRSLPAPWAIGWGGNISVRRDMLGDRFRFDENYKTWGAEDLDLSLTLFEAGAQFAFCRQASGIHLPHPRSHEVNARSSRPNKIYLNNKFRRPETELLIDVQSWDLNDALIKGAQAQAE
ncbi:MAG: glycosyltransferase family 2 protein [Hyphomicrobiales bacterium]|nr:glycosyltransferase family 2 protein [Hyphomicrobiales bacterium]MBV8663218.1 glycosyltransferase family 2 protein [Hyphomicrobiales bacterium]